MKKPYETPKAEGLEFDYTESVVASNAPAVTNKNPNQGCNIGAGGQTFQNANKCGSGTTTKNKKC